MTRKTTAAERYCLLYYGVATPSFGPEMRDDDALRSVLSAWRGPDASRMDQVELDGLFRFAETEFYERMKEIAQVAGKICAVPPFRFNFLRVGNYEALFNRFDCGEPLIFIDSDYIDILFAFFASRIFETYFCDSSEIRTSLQRYAGAVLRSFVLGERMSDDVRNAAAPIFARSEHASGIAMSLSRTAAYFILAHELAHHSLGHTGADDTFDTELAADALAAKIYGALGQEKGLQWASVPDGYMGAPLLYLEFLNTIEQHGTRLWTTDRVKSDYPAARKRRSEITRFLAPRSAEDRGLYLDMRKSIARLNVFLRNRQMPHQRS